MTREHLDAVGELHQRLQRAKQPFGALPGSHCQVRAGHIPDEQRIAREHEPRLVAARAIGHDEAAMLRPVAGRMDDAKRDRADLQFLAVAERIVRVVDASLGMNTHWKPVLEGQAAVSRDVVGMSMRLDHADEPHALPVGRGKQRLDCIRRVDHDGDLGLFVTDQVTRAPEILIEKLLEDHGATVAPRPAIDLEVCDAAARGRLPNLRRSRPRPPAPPQSPPTDAPRGRRRPAREGR